MAADYTSLKKFIKQVILDDDLELNSLDTTRSIVQSITGQFAELGWSVLAVPNNTDRMALHELVSPDGKLSLSMRGGKVYRHSGATETICRRKNLTKILLELEGVPVPKGAHFLPTEQEVARAYFLRLPKPVVVKPTDAAGSRGVTVGVREIDAFNSAWSHAQQDNRRNSNIIVEQFVPGVELRAYVVGDATVSIVARIQPFVVGDGRLPIKDLIPQILESRERNFRTKNYSVKVDWLFVRHQGFGKNSVPKKDEIIFLNPFSTGAAGGLSVEVTHLVSPTILEMAVQAKRSIPDLEVAGIDILISDLRNADSAFVIEVNTAPSPDLHRYATHGTPRAVDSDVVNYFHRQYIAQSQSVKPSDSTRL